MTNNSLAAPSSFDSGGQFAFDNTSLALYKTCPRKYQYRMVENWQPRRKSVHLLFGGWYAGALEFFYKRIAEGVEREEAIIDTVFWALVETWEYGYPTPRDAQNKTNPIPNTGQPWDSDDTNKTRETLIRSIIWYLDNFKDDNCITAELTDGVPAVELSFKVEIGNNILYCGHLDQLVMFGDELMIMDQKTTGSTINKRYWEQWDTSAQMSGYTFGGKMAFHMPVRGVIIDAAQIMIGGTRFERGFTYRTEDDLEEWLDETHTYAARARASFKEQKFLRNTEACGNYGGCEFRHVCGKTKHLRHNFLRGDFTQANVQWNPLENR